MANEKTPSPDGSNRHPFHRSDDVNLPSIHIKHLHLHLPPPLFRTDIGHREACGTGHTDENRFAISADGSYVTDRKTGIQWATDVTTTDSMSYDEAEKHVGGLTIGGLSGWFIGTLEQRETIIDRTRFNPAMPAPFKASGGYEWTSTPYLPSGNNNDGKPRAFWQVRGYYGSVHHGGRSSRDGFVRPCRLVAPGQ
jgi:hypothetical protein